MRRPIEARQLAGAARRWRPHVAAIAVLVLAIGVAAVGGSVPKPAQRVRADAAATDTPGALALGDSTDGGAATADTAGAAPGTGSGPAAQAAGSQQAAGATARAATGPHTYDVGVTDSAIRIGGSTFTSGPAAVYGEQIAVGFAAGVQYVNDHGGVNGRRIVLTLYDDGGDPAKQLANTKRLVEVDKVFALSMVYAPTVGDYVSQHAIPVFHLGQFDEEFTNPYWFSLGGPQRLASYSMANYGVRKLGVKSVAVFYLDAGTNNYSRAYADQVASDWKAYGVDVPVLASFAPDQTSCSDAISKASSAKVDFIQFEIDASKVINCGVEAQIQGYKPPKGWGGYLIGVPVIPEALGDFSEGMYAFDAFGANYDVPDYSAYVHRVSPKTEPHSSVTASYFIAALLARDSIGKLGDDITRPRLIDTLNHFTNWRPGLTDDPNQPSWTWTPQCHIALKGGYVIQVQKGDDGKLAWHQITPMFTSTPVPPGTQPPARYAACPIFSKG